MIAHGDAIGAAAIGDAGRRVLPSEFQGPALPLPGRPRPFRPRHIIARR
jgi:hypothetical protein